MKKWKKSLVLLFALLLMCIMSACSPVKITGDLSINSDGTGTRSIVGKIDKVDVDDNGCTYYYFKLHGDDLKAWLENKYAELVPGSEEWLKITVSDSGAKEVVTLSFDFASFDEHAARLKALGYAPEFSENYVEPVVTMKDGVISEYSESTNVMTAIMKSIQTTFLADETVYDDACTMDGKSLNGGSSDGVTSSNGVELLGAGDGPALTIQVDGGELEGLFAEKESEEEDAAELYHYTVSEKTGQSVKDPQKPDDTNQGQEPEQPEKSGISTATIVVVVIAVVVVILIVILIVLKRKKKQAK